MVFKLGSSPHKFLCDKKNNKKFKSAFILQLWGLPSTADLEDLCLHLADPEYTINNEPIFHVKGKQVSRTGAPTPITMKVLSYKTRLDFHFYGRRAPVHHAII